MKSKWDGIKLDEIYADWAESLGKYSLGAINFAIVESKNTAHPPNLGEFMKHCQAYKPVDIVLIEKKFIKDAEMAKKHLDEIREMLTSKMVVSDE
jgi:hypothetical protein